MNKPFRIISLLSLVSITILFVNANYKPEIEPISNTHKYYKIKALKLPSKMNFAGERVPLEIADVKERMDRELLVNTYWQSNGLLLLKRAHKYFPILEPLLRKHGLPRK